MSWPSYTLFYFDFIAWSNTQSIPLSTRTWLQISPTRFRQYYLSSVGKCAISRVSVAILSQHIRFDIFLISSVQAAERTAQGATRTIRSWECKLSPQDGAAVGTNIHQYYYLEYSTELSRSTYWSTIYFDKYAWKEKLSEFPALSKHLLLAGSQPYQAASLEILRPPEPNTQAFRPPPDLELDPGIYDAVDQTRLSDDLRSLVWSGLHLKLDETPDESSSAGFLHIDISESMETGILTGTGCDDSGDFDVDGNVQGGGVTFSKQYKSPITSQPRYYRGSLDYDKGIISGVWGYSPDIVDVPAPDATVIVGHFQYSHSPIRFPFISVDQELKTGLNRPHAMWRYAIRTVIHVARLRAGRPTWEYLRERRNIRNQFIQYYTRLRSSSSDLAIDSQPLDSQDVSRLAQIEYLCSKQDIEFYKQLAEVLARRRIVHWYVARSSLLINSS